MATLQQILTSATTGLPRLDVTCEDLQVDGKATVDGKADLKGDLDVGGDLEVTGTSTLIGNVTVAPGVFAIDTAATNFVLDLVGCDIGGDQNASISTEANGPGVNLTHCIKCQIAGPLTRWIPLFETPPVGQTL